MTTKDPVARLGDPMDWPECEEFHLDLSADRLAPLEIAKLTPEALDDLDWMAKAVANGWHLNQETSEHIMALVRAVPRLTAALRRSGCT